MWEGAELCGQGRSLVGGEGPGWAVVDLGERGRTCVNGAKLCGQGQSCVGRARPGCAGENLGGPGRSCVSRGRAVWAGADLCGRGQIWVGGGGAGWMGAELGDPCPCREQRPLTTSQAEQSSLPCPCDKRGDHGQCSEQGIAILLCEGLRDPTASVATAPRARAAGDRVDLAVSMETFSTASGTWVLWQFHLA